MNGADGGGGGVQTLEKQAQLLCLLHRHAEHAAFERARAKGLDPERAESASRRESFDRGENFVVRTIGAGCCLLIASAARSGR